MFGSEVDNCPTHCEQMLFFGCKGGDVLSFWKEVERESLGCGRGSDFLQKMHYINVIKKVRERTVRLESGLSSQQSNGLFQKMDCKAPTDRSHLIYSKILEDDEEPTENPDSRSTPVVQLEVELENGSKVYISPQPNDHPYELASRFCQQHNLDSSMVPLLADSIQKSIDYSQDSINESQSRGIATEPSQVLITEPYPAHRAEKQDLPFSCSFSKKSSVNSQVSLYDKGMIFTEQHRLWIQSQREQKVNMQKRQCTYIPKINKMSKSLASERSVSRVQCQEVPSRKKKQCCGVVNNQNMPRCISSSVILAEFSKESQTRERRSCELKSRDLNRQPSQGVFEDLYQNKKGSHKHKASYNSKETHRPQINQISREIVGRKNFSERMVAYEQEKQKKRQRIQANQQKENAYRPRTGPAPAHRNVQHLPIGDFLYKNRKTKVPVMVMPPPVPVISQTSRKIYEERKENAFKQIFLHLAHSEDKVCWDRLDFKEVDCAIMPILFPLLEEIQIMQIELNQSDFSTALNYLFGTLNPEEKNIILTFSSERQPSVEHSPLPTMNRKSQEIVRGTNREGMRIYDYCELRGVQREEQLQFRRVERERKQMEECTFQPRIERKPLYF